MATSLKRKFKDSGYMMLKNTSSFDFNEIYYPTLDLRWENYDDVRVFNNSSSDIKVTINQTREYIIVSGSDFQFNELVNDISILNIGNFTINANEIRIAYRYTGFEGKKIKENIGVIGQIVSPLASRFIR